MSDTSDFKKLDLQEPTAEEENSFASWLPPILGSAPAVPPAATLTGLGPPSGPRASAAPEPPVSDFMEPLDTDDDDAPTRVISQLFPNLAPKARSNPIAGSRPGASAAPPLDPSSASTEADVLGPASGVVEGQRDLKDEVTAEDIEAAPPSWSSDEVTRALVSPALSTAEAAASLAPPDAAAPTDLPGAGSRPRHDPMAQTLQAEVPSVRADHPSRGRSSPPVRYNVAPVVRETDPFEASGASDAALALGLVDARAPSLAPPEVPTNGAVPAVPAIPNYPPSVEIAKFERERPTSPSSRRPTQPPTGEGRAAILASLRSEAPWAASVGPKAPGGKSGPPKVALKYAVGAFAASALVTVLVLRALLPGKGAVLVTAVGAGGMPVENAQVLVDGAPACSPVPCRVNKLREGRHLVTVKAQGYQPVADRAILVDADGEALVHFALNPENNAGVHVRVAGKGLRVFVDGEDRGEAPLTLAGLTPTEHVIRIAGSPQYAPFEQRVTLRPNSTLTFEPTLVALQSIITISAGPGAESAAVEVLGGPERKAVVELPARIEVPPLGSYRVRATRPGYNAFETEVRFGEGEAEKQVKVELTPVSALASVAAAPAPPAAKGPAPVVPVVLEEAPRPGPSPASAQSKPAPIAALAAGVASGSLNISSNPPSNVLVDGRPVGGTPRQLALPPGSHSVVFVHPTRGRKTLTVKVEPGKTAVASATF